MAYEPAFVDEAAPAAPLQKLSEVSQEEEEEGAATPPLRVTVASAAGSPPLSVAVPGDARRRGRKTSVPDQQFGVRALVPTTAPAGPKRARAGEVPWASPIGPLRAEREALLELKREREAKEAAAMAGTHRRAGARRAARCRPVCVRVVVTC